LDWNSIENSRHGMTFSLKVPSKFIPSQWNRIECPPLANQDFSPATEKHVVLSGTIPHLEFILEK